MHNLSKKIVHYSFSVNILINGSPTELNRDAYKHVYLLTKGTQNKTRIARLISDKQL